MSEYVVVKAPTGGSGEDFICLWLNGNSAMGRELVSTYSEFDELYFVFRLVELTANGAVVE